MTVKERVAIVTGASAGIGKETARALLAQGWRVIGIGRDPGRCAAAEAELSATGGRFEMLRVDLSVLRDVVRAADEIARRVDRVDVLVNNAGGIPGGKVVTSEGNDENFAGNHLGPFLLTDRLSPLIRRAAADAPAGAVRIIVTSSLASESPADLAWDDLQAVADFNAGQAYAHAKLANSLFAAGLAARWADDGVVVHAVHPGTVRSNFSSHAEAGMRSYLDSLEAFTPEEGADTLIWAATADEPGNTTNGYFYQRAPRTPNPLVHDKGKVDRLWRETEGIIAATLG